MKALAIIFDGFEECEAVSPFALLRRANIELTITSDKNTVVGSHNISLTNICNINEIDYKEYDCLIIPGGAHYKTLKSNTLVHKIIKYFMDNNKIVSAICAAPTIIGMLGYLKERNYTCFTAMNDDFGGNYIETGVVVDGNLITARSVAYAIDFGYAIIEKMMGLEKLNEVLEKIYYEK